MDSVTGQTFPWMNVKHYIFEKNKPTFSSSSPATNVRNLTLFFLSYRTAECVSGAVRLNSFQKLFQLGSDGVC